MAESEVEEMDIHDLITARDVSHGVSLREAEAMWRNRNKFNRIFLITSQDSGKKYLIGERKDGRWMCSCPHYVFRLMRAGGECKHIRFVKNNIHNLVPLYDASKRDMAVVVTMFDNVIPEEILETGGVYIVESDMDLSGGFGKEADAEYEDVPLLDDVEEDAEGYTAATYEKKINKEVRDVGGMEIIDDPTSDLLPRNVLYEIEEIEEEDEDEMEL